MCAKGRQGWRDRRGRERRRQRLGRRISKPREATSLLQYLDLGRGKGRVFLRARPGSPALPTPAFRVSGLQNGEHKNFCCVNILNLWR